MLLEQQRLIFFDFSGTPTVTANLRADKDRRNGYMVRCVRNEIPESYMRVGIIISPDYQGTESGKTAYFGIVRIFLTGRLHLSLQERMWERQLPMISRLNPENDAVPTTHGRQYPKYPYICQTQRKYFIPFV